MGHFDDTICPHPKNNFSLQVSAKSFDDLGNRMLLVLFSKEKVFFFTFFKKNIFTFSI